MPAPMPEGEQGMAVWWALYGGDDDPELKAAAKEFLALVATRKPPGALQ
jgi:hypothetical protein